MFERKGMYSIHYIACCVITEKISNFIKIKKIKFEVERVYRYGCAIYVSVCKNKKFQIFKSKILQIIKKNNNNVLKSMN